MRPRALRRLRRLRHAGWLALGEEAVVVTDRQLEELEELESCIARREPLRNWCAACLDGEPERCEVEG